MSQNRSTAVMQRRVEPHDSLDDFPTPPWATRALCEWLSREVGSLGSLTCREPAANRGYMVRPLSEHFASVQASDVHDYGHGFDVADYLFGLPPATVDWTITNPPFRLAEQFLQRMIDTSRVGCAVIVRSAFLEGGERFASLFSPRPPAFALQFVERVVMMKATVRQAGAKYVDQTTGEEKTASSATAYSWLIWLPGQTDTRLRWIPPCRERLERAGDYPDEAVAVDAGPLFGGFAS